MTPPMPKIKSVMTPFPYSVSPSATVEEAQAMMREHGIHHLPVCENHTVIGILSDRDTRVALGALGMEGREGPITVGSLCTRTPYVVDLDAPLDTVASHMAAERIGSALVMRGDKLAGILTTTDVCRLLSSLLQKVYSTSGDDEVA